jgi:phytoene dehydrogenase-like protein
LGLPFALAACKTENPRQFTGEIVGANVDFGHRLRGGLNIEIPADKWRQVSVAIVGGGIAGLTAAWKLRQKSFTDFTLLELEKEVGGTSQSGAAGVVPHPWGAHYLPVPFAENTELVKLLDEMRLTEGRAANGDVIVKEQFLCREPEERVFYKGRWYEGLYLRAGASPEDLRQLDEFQREIDRWVNWLDARGRRAFVVPVANCSDDAEATALDRISFADWLDQKNLTSLRLRWYCDYACRDDYGLKLEQTSAWAGLFYFCSRVKKSGAESQAFITFPEGNGRFVAHFRSAAQDNIRSGFGVARIIPRQNRVDLICLNAETNEALGIHAKKVIFSAPIFSAPYLIEGWREKPPFDAAAFQHNAWFVANLHLKERPKDKFQRDFPLAWDNVLYESPSLGYVNAAHQKGLDHGPAVFTYYYPMCAHTAAPSADAAPEAARAKLLALGWRELADICLTDLSRAHSDIAALTERIDIMRWGHAMISPRPRFIHNGERLKALQPDRNIHFAHSDLSGIALFEEAFYHGITTAENVMRII